MCQEMPMRVTCPALPCPAMSSTQVHGATLRRSAARCLCTAAAGAGSRYPLLGGRGPRDSRRHRQSAAPVTSHDKEGATCCLASTEAAPDTGDGTGRGVAQRLGARRGSAGRERDANAAHSMVLRSNFVGNMNGFLCMTQPPPFSSRLQTIAP